MQVELFAHEPMLINPTAIDVDHKGRVWVAEAVNYRRKLFNRPIIREDGDRIVVLIDKDGDGKADESVVFYQGKDLYAPLSVLVLPQADGKSLRVLVAQSPDILEFWDRDGDLKADGPPTKFLSGFGGFDHDHGVHGLTVGPDGKLYFTVGDQGVNGLQSKDGKGPKFTTNKTDCQAGTVWRCDLNGNNLELGATLTLQALLESEHCPAALKSALMSKARLVSAEVIRSNALRWKTPMVPAARLAAASPDF